MKMHFVSPVLMLVTAVIFAAVGLRSLPKNNAYVILGIAFALIAAAGFRRARRAERTPE